MDASCGSRPAARGYAAADSGERIK
jgi:hypothetical protein